MGVSGVRYLVSILPLLRTCVCTYIVGSWYGLYLRGWVDPVVVFTQLVDNKFTVHFIRGVADTRPSLPENSVKLGIVIRSSGRLGFYSFDVWHTACYLTGI